MDRRMVYPGEIPLELDALESQQNAYIALAKIAAALFGTSTQYNGLTVGASTPAALTVDVAPGEVYMLANLNPTAFSSIAVDTTHAVLKQAIMLDKVTLATAAPGTVGFSVNYLIQATLTETDTDSVVLPYYNASNPSQPYAGPANAGTSQATRRKNTVTVSAKAGVAATTGTQATPAPDAGYVGIAVVTVANGQATVTGGNITAYANSPVINNTLHGLTPAFLVDVLGKTAPQFDNTLKLATMAAVNARGVAFPSGSALGITSSPRTIQPSEVNNTIYCSGTAAAITLPSIAAVPNGSVIALHNNSANPLTITRAGSDTIFMVGGGQTSLAVPVSDNVILVAAAFGWMCIGGSAQLQTAGVFANSLGASGYQKLPSGLIVQWGASTASAAGSAVTFPIAFPTACYAITSGINNGSETTLRMTGVSTSGFTFQSVVATAAHFWIAIGK